jgi:hypothetical protein
VLRRGKVQSAERSQNAVEPSRRTRLVECAGGLGEPIRQIATCTKIELDERREGSRAEGDTKQNTGVFENDGIGASANPVERRPIEANGKNLGAGRIGASTKQKQNGNS